MTGHARYTIYLRGGGVLRVELPEGAVRVEDGKLKIADDLPRSLSSDQLLWVDRNRIEAIGRHPATGAEAHGPSGTPGRGEGMDPMAKLQELAEEFFGRRMRT